MLRWGVRRTSQPCRFSKPLCASEMRLLRACLRPRILALVNARDRPGTLDVAALQGRPSHSADAARLEQVRADLALGVRERMLRALDLGLLMKAQKSASDGSR